VTDSAAQAFEEFVGSRGPALLRFAYLLTRDTGLAEDLVQNALVKAHRRWSRQTLAEHPEAYVRRIVLHEFVSWRRRRSNAEVPGVIPDVAHTDPVDQFVERDLVWQVLGQLPRRQRAVLVLRYYEALPDADIAALLDCAPGTVRSLAARAFATLRQHPELAAEPLISYPEEAS
jgi:RNA polymerase sigma-70 factor (sigma-E family)